MSLAPFDRVQAFSVVVAAGVTQAAPTETSLVFAPGEVVGIEIVIPDGHSGLTGLQLATAHQPVIPYTVGQWIIGNDDKIEWPMHNLPNTGNFQARTYNSDIFAHTFYLRFLVAENNRAAQATALTPPLTLP